MLKRTILFGLLMALAGTAGAVKAVKTVIHTDHLGSPIMGRSMDGETLWERHYEPYGSQDQAPGDPASAGYTGHLEERDSGLVYAGARWYDPRIGRFMSPDPVGFSVSNPVSFNRYAYANNNPIAYVDPDGRAALGVILITAAALSVMENANAPDVGEKPSKYSTAGLAPAAILVSGGVIVEAGAIGAAAAGTGARLVAKQAQRTSAGFKGGKRFELKNAPYQKVRNKATSINGREFSGHALDQMQNRGVMPSVVNNAIKTGDAFLTRAGTKGFYDAANKVRVITDSQTGRVITVIRGAPK